MSRILELPDAVFTALQKVACDRGMTPAGWIAALISQILGDESEGLNGSKELTLAEKFRGRTGRIASGSKEGLSDNCGQQFTDHLEAKRQAGHL